MKILYGVPGEGMGHATRSKVVITWLLAQGHDVTIVSSSRAFTFLQNHFGNRVIEIEGLHLSYHNAIMSIWGSIWINLKRIHLLLGKNLLTFLRLSFNYRPDLIITDFESFSHLYAFTHSIKAISIDNIQVANRCKLDGDVPLKEQINQWLAAEVIAIKVPAVQHYLITSFFEVPPIFPNTEMVKPIVRQQIEQAIPRVGKHILMYQTSASAKNIEAVLGNFPQFEFRVYGMNKDESIGNVHYKKFSEDGFIDDLASACGVISNGGFSLISEAVYLHKPVYSFPIKNQFEQYLNARYIENCGYGIMAETLKSEDLMRFLENLERFRENLSEYRQHGNQILFERLQQLMCNS